MKHCKFCDQPMQWGREGDRWIALVPVGMDDGLDRTHQDEDGNLRAKHVCQHGTAVNVVRLPVPVPAHAVMPQAEVDTRYDPTTEPPLNARARRKKRKGRGNEGDLRDGSFPYGAFE